MRPMPWLAYGISERLHRFRREICGTKNSFDLKHDKSPKKSLIGFFIFTSHESRRLSFQLTGEVQLLMSRKLNAAVGAEWQKPATTALTSLDRIDFHARSVIIDVVTA